MLQAHYAIPYDLSSTSQGPFVPALTPVFQYCHVAYVSLCNGGYGPIILLILFHNVA